MTIIKKQAIKELYINFTMIMNFQFKIGMPSINFNKSEEYLKMVFERVRKILVDQLDVEESSITMDSNLMDDLDADSLDLVDLVMSIEDEFGAEVSDDEVENLKTVGDIVRYIDAHADDANA